MRLNPCAFYQESEVVAVHRRILDVLMMFDLAFILGLRLLSIFFRNHHKQRIDDLLKQQTIRKEVIQVETIGKAEITEPTSINLYPQTKEEGNNEGPHQVSSQKGKKSEERASSESSSNSEEEREEEEGDEERSNWKY
jgi:hypothetical protein